MNLLSKNKYLLGLCLDTGSNVFFNIYANVSEQNMLLCDLVLHLYTTNKQAQQEGVQKTLIVHPTVNGYGLFFKEGDALKLELDGFMCVLENVHSKPILRIESKTYNAILSLKKLHIQSQNEEED